jgi:radical SAM protein with 4Fe4S-binding SPASM domain
LAVERVDYGSFSAALHAEGRRAALPMNATFELTRRCPLTCQHCYNNLPVGDRDARTRELSSAEHQRILDELSALGCLWLLYTGGEIFTRPDFFDIYTHAKQRGFIITLFTNGTLVTPAIADRLAAAPPFSIEITLYGGSRETYERVTGVPGSFERCRRGIELLLARKLPLRLKTVALTINRHEIDEMKAFAAGLGVPFKYDAMMTPRLDCSLSPLEVRLKPEETVELDLRDERRMSEWSSFAAQFLGPARRPAPAEQVYSCGGGVSSFAVDPYGGMSICVLSEREKYDLRQGSVTEGWTQFLRRVRARQITRTTKCTGCAIKPLCGMCPAQGELENGDPEAPVDFLCEVAHLRAKALDLAVPAHAGCEFCAGGAKASALDAAFARLTQAVQMPIARPKAAGRRPTRLALLGEPATCGAHDGCASCGNDGIS